MERIGAVQACVDKILAGQEKAVDVKFGYVHLYSVSQACAMLAMKRRLNVELAAVAGLLHDIYAYKTGSRNDHAHQGAVLAGEIMRGLELFSEEEIDMVSRAIYHHSDKDTVDSPFDEMLKDADVLQHVMIMPLAETASHEAARFGGLKTELGLN